MFDITLINPNSPFLTSPRVMPPLGILYVIASLEKQGYKVDFIDLAGHKKEDKLHSLETKTFGITSTTSQYPDVLEIKNFLKKHYPDVPIVLGGAHSTVFPEQCIEDGFDCVIIGEGEFVAKDFIEGKRGVINAEPIKGLDNCPFPDRRLVLDYEYTIDNIRTTTMMTSRGCPYNCAFCCKNWGNLIRFRSLGNVMDEIDEIARLGYRGIMFYDDEMLIDWDRDKKIFNYLHELGFVWRCFSRADILTKDENRIKYMADNGCKEILIGIESGSNKILKIINKQTTVELNIKAIKMLHDNGIRVKASMIIGLPNETTETLMETWGFCNIVRDYVSDWDFSVLVPYPGSDICNHPEKYDVIYDRDDIYNPFKVGGVEWKAIVSTTSLSKDDITRWRNKFAKEFKK